MSMTNKQTLMLAFIKTRNAARSVATRLHHLGLNQRVNRRMLKRAEILEKAGVVSAALPHEIQAHIDATELSIDLARACQAEIGELLNRILPCLDVELSLNDRYDLFNVNPVHRRWTGADAPSSLEMILAHGIEDSADKHADWMDGPLFECLHVCMWRFFRTDPRGRVSLDFMSDAAFGPGGPFEHVTLQRIHPDGTVEDVPPSERAKAPAGATLH